MAENPIGKVTHYFDKIGVAVVEIVDGNLSTGDQIKIVGRGEEFTQTVGSMQIEHKNIETAQKGDTVGLKVDRRVKEGDQIFKVLEE
jgi:putative protease